MANIPYGYRIENGSAVPDREKVDRFNRFINEYLNGASLKTARELSGVEPGIFSLNQYLRKGTYQGTSYYPAIVPEGTHEKVLAEHERRKHKGNRKIPDDLPVKSHFYMKKAEVPCKGNASEVAALIYSLIIPAEEGREIILPGELEMVRKWARE